MSGVGEFSVCQFFVDDSYDYEMRNVDPETAVTCAHRLAGSVGGRIGTTRRVIITDGGDCVAWEWKWGEGIVFPPQCAMPTVTINRAAK